MQKNLVILHGWGANSQRFDGLIRVLSEAGWQIWAPDLPGFGHEPPPDVAWRLDDYRAWVVDRLRRHCQNCGWSNYWVLGHSFGGSIAIKLALRQDKSLSGLILAAPAAVREPLTGFKWFLMVFAKMGQFFFRLPLLSRFDQPVRRLLYRMLRNPDYSLVVGTMKRTMREILREDLRRDVGDLRVPVLLLWGGRDRLTPRAHGQLLQQLIPGSELKVLENQGHNFIYHETEWVRQQLEIFVAEF